MEVNTRMGEVVSTMSERRIEMGRVCENCGWRENPNDNTGRSCIFSNPKKKKAWKDNEYNQPCEHYVMDTVLLAHLKALLRK